MMWLMKKLWLLCLILFSMLIAGGWYFLEQPSLSDAAPRYIFQTITANSCNSRTITWQVPSTVSEQKIVYRIAGSSEVYSVEALGKSLTTADGSTVVYSVTLGDLQPGILYQYKVGCEEQWSDWYTFRTAPAAGQAFKTIIFGDSQSTDYSVWAHTAQHAWLRNPAASFFINMGDLVDIGSHYPQWQAWFDGGAEMMRNIPVAAVSGNHENYLPGGSYTPADLYLQFFHLPENGPAGLQRQAYSFDYGTVHFTVLDSQEEELAEFQPDLIKAQVAWLEKDLQQTTQPWKVILIHRSLFQNRMEGQLNTLGERFVPVFDRYHVDVVFSAHIHSYGRSVPLVHNKAAKNGQHGSVYISTGRSGNIPWDGSKKKYFEKSFDLCLDQPNYLILESGAEYLTITDFKQDGTVVDTVELQH